MFTAETWVIASVDIALSVDVRQTTSNQLRTHNPPPRERADYLEVVDDEIGCPTFTRDLSAAIRQLTASGRYGTTHLTSSGCTGYELACATFELGGPDVEVRHTSASKFGRLAPAPDSLFSIRGMPE